MFLRTNTIKLICTKTSRFYHTIPQVSRTITNTIQHNNNTIQYKIKRNISNDNTTEINEQNSNTNNLHDEIQQAVKSSKVLLFMKGTPESPQCGFSYQVVQLQNHLSMYKLYIYVLYIILNYCKFINTDTSYDSCNILESQELRETVKKFSNWPTFPQLYINGEFVGGCDLITNLFTSGELQQMISKANSDTAEQNKPSNPTN